MLSGNRLIADNGVRAASRFVCIRKFYLITKASKRRIRSPLDSAGNIYVSDHGASHQVKVFSPAGKFLRAIGRAGSAEGRGRTTRCT